VRASSIVLVALGAALAALVMPPNGEPATRPAAEGRPAPPFTQTQAAGWLNSPPLTWEALRGKVTLVEFWTFACWNCYRSIPWLQTLEPRFRGRGLRIVSIHTPEFAHERVRANVDAKLGELGVRFPVMLDNDYAYWNAMDNRYWPAFYLVDGQGRVRASFAGETHVGDRNAAAIEAAIESLLIENTGKTP